MENINLQCPDWITKFLKLKSQQMGLVSKDEPKEELEFEILKYENGLPTEIEVYLPSDFDRSLLEGFVDCLNNLFYSDKFEWIERRDIYWFNKRKSIILNYVEKLPEKINYSFDLLKETNKSFFPLGISQIKDNKIVGFNLNSNILITGEKNSGKTNLLKTIINSSLGRSEDYLLFVISRNPAIKKYEKYGVPTATTFEDAVSLCTYVEATMMERIEEIEKRGINNWDEMPDNLRGPNIILLIQDNLDFLEPMKLSHNSEPEEKVNLNYQNKFLSSIKSIVTNYNEFANVHLIISTIKPELVSQIKYNFQDKIIMGHLPQSTSQMVINSFYASTLINEFKGRGIIRNNSLIPFKFQAFYNEPDCLDNFLKENNLPEKINGHSLFLVNNEEDNKWAEDENFKSLSDDEYKKLIDIIES